MQRPIAIDLFSGCGGMSLGLEAAGFDIAASVEFDAVHLLVHHFNFPYSVSICQDIRNLSTLDLLARLKHHGFEREIDLVAGGPPCQGFSMIGKRQLDDPRNSLVFQYFRIIKELQPKYFIFENVPGIASGNHRALLDELIAEFEGISYWVNYPWKILDAADFGAPQHRKRLILIGSRQDVKKAGYPGEREGKISTVGEAISDLAKVPAWIGKDEGIDSCYLNYSGFRQSFSITPAGEYHLCHFRPTGDLVWGHLGSQHTEVSRERFLGTEPGTVEKISRFFKLSPDRLCHTLRAGTARDRGAFTAPRPIHYCLPRCVTVREAARLHTFPDWFQFHTTIWHGFREIGNAVVPLFSKALGLQIMSCLEVDRSQLEIRKLSTMDRECLRWNMDQACLYWQIPNNVIPKRKRDKRMDIGIR